MLSILYKQQQLMSTYLGHLVTRQTGGIWNLVIHLEFVYIYALLLSLVARTGTQQVVEITPVNSTTLTVSWSAV